MTAREGMAIGAKPLLREKSSSQVRPAGSKSWTHFRLYVEPTTFLQPAGPLPALRSSATVLGSLQHDRLAIRIVQHAAQAFETPCCVLELFADVLHLCCKDSYIAGNIRILRCRGLQGRRYDLGVHLLEADGRCPTRT